MTTKARAYVGRLAGLVAPLALLPAAPLEAQSTAPSSITPQSLRPPPTASGDDAALPAAGGLTPPSGAEGLRVTPSGIEVEGGFPEVAADTAAIVAPFAGRRVTLAQLYEAASAIEAAHVRAGFLLARVTVPPQTLTDGAPVRFVVVDGFVEQVDTSALPTRVRDAAARRLAGVQGRRHLRLRRIEQPLVRTAELPGLAMTSTLARGDQAGGVRLLIAGRQRPVSGSVSAQNGLAASLGRVAVTGQLALNSLLGRGEQFYGFVTSGHDPGRAFSSEAPVTVLGGGAVLPSADGRFSLNPEATFSRTRPAAQPGVPRTLGRLRRLTLRASYAPVRLRRRSLTIGATMEQIQESNDATDFATRLSLDRFWAARVQLDYSAGFARGGGLALSVQASRGIGGLDLRGVATSPFYLGPSPSRQGAAPDFTKLEGSLRLLQPLSHKLQLLVISRAQWSLGQPLFRSEQSALEGADAVSAYVGGITAVDEAVTGRLELARPLAAGRRLQLSPYVFGAAGHGGIARPTAVERATLDLASAGAGVRAGIGGAGVSLAAEYAHGFADRTGYRGADRVNLTLAKSF